jgi:hypothetical protein
LFQEKKKTSTDQDQSFWQQWSVSGSGSGLTEAELGILDNPFPVTLHPTLFHLRPNVLVDEAQPSTIIAYALGSSEHKEFVLETPAASNGSKNHLDCQFGDDEAGTSKFFCRIHFVHEFESFRRQVFEAEADMEDFLTSLSHCDPWQTSGGKSGATFYKTKDGRFLLKQVNKHEMVTFQNIAMRYLII